MAVHGWCAQSPSSHEQTIQRASAGIPKPSRRGGGSRPTHVRVCWLTGRLNMEKTQASRLCIAWQRAAG